MQTELQTVRQELRRRSWLLRSVQIRQAARWVFDKARFGNGPVERLLAALILAAVFVLMALGSAAVAKLGANYGLLLAGTALMSVLGVSAVLILWTRSDETLETARRRLGEEVLELRERAAELQDAADEEDARRQEEQEDEDDRTGRDRSERTPRRRERRSPRTQRCPFCQEMISARALKCRHCGEILDEELARERRPRTYSPGIAAILSLFFPGLGQLYKGQVFAAIGWHFLIDFVYAASILGTFLCCVGVLGFPVAVILHVLCLFDAAAEN